jgi:hypothetical protein
MAVGGYLPDDYPDTLFVMEQIMKGETMPGNRLAEVFLNYFRDNPSKFIKEYNQGNTAYWSGKKAFSEWDGKSECPCCKRAGDMADADIRLDELLADCLKG